MAPTTQQTASNTTGHAEGHRRLRDWTTRFHAALSDTEAYGKVHHGLFREFEQLCDEVRGSDRRSIIPYVDAIFNHTASQGYQQAVHYDPLFNGLVAYCKNLPPPIWVAPADQFDKSPTPTLPPIPKETSRSPSRTIAPRPLPKKLSHNPAHIPKAAGPAQPTKTGKQATDMPQAGPGPGTIAKGKGRADKAVKRGATSMPATATVHVKHLPKGKKRSKLSKDWIDITTDDEEKESSEEEKKSVPSANQKEPVKCVTCERDGHPCMTNPSTVGNVSPACYECFQRKRKCSLCTKPAGESRKKKTTVAVAAGSAGELTSKSIVCTSLNTLNMSFY
jgi:hypothetical protein